MASILIFESFHVAWWSWLSAIECNRFVSERDLGNSSRILSAKETRNWEVFENSKRNIACDSLLVLHRLVIQNIDSIWPFISQDFQPFPNHKIISSSIWVDCECWKQRRQSPRFSPRHWRNAIFSRKQENGGCLRFDVLRDKAKANKFVFYEVYADEAAAATHQKKPHFKLCSDFKAFAGELSQVVVKTDGIFIYI